MSLPEVFPQEQGIDARSVSANDYVLIIVGKDLRLDKITGAQQIGHGPGFADRTQGPLTEPVVVSQISTMQFFASQSGKLFARASSEVTRDINPLEARERSQPDVVKLRQQKRVDEMPAIECELWIINCLFRNLKSQRPGT